MLAYPFEAIDNGFAVAEYLFLCALHSSQFSCVISMLGLIEVILCGDYILYFRAGAGFLESERTDENPFIRYGRCYPLELGEASICLVQLLENALGLKVALERKGRNLIHTQLILLLVCL